MEAKNEAIVQCLPPGFLSSAHDYTLAKLMLARGRAVAVGSTSTTMAGPIFMGKKILNTCLCTLVN